MRRNASAALALSCLLGLSGCYVPLGIAYPTLSYTPTVAIPADAVKELYAFRVDVVESPHAAKPAKRTQSVFSEIDLAARNEVPGQMAAGLRYYWGLFFLPSGDSYPKGVHSRDTHIRVRLYRRGFKTIEIGPDSDRDTALDWEAVDNHREREEAIDDLLGVKGDSFVHLAPGRVSKKHELSLRFAAEEYLDLARMLDKTKADQLRIHTRALKKFERLRDLETD